MSKEKKITLNKRDFVEEFIDFIKDLFIIILFVLFVKTFLISPFQIS